MINISDLDIVKDDVIEKVIPRITFDFWFGLMSWQEEQWGLGESQWFQWEKLQKYYFLLYRNIFFFGGVLKDR